MYGQTMPPGQFMPQQQQPPMMGNAALAQALQAPQGMPQQMPQAPMPAVQPPPQPAQMTPFRGQPMGGFSPPSPGMQQQQMVRGLFGLPGGR